MVNLNVFCYFSIVIPIYDITIKPPVSGTVSSLNPIKSLLWWLSHVKPIEIPWNPINQPSVPEVERDSVVEVWCEGLWCRGRVRSVEENSCAIDFFDGHLDLPSGAQRGKLAFVVGESM